MKETELAQHMLKYMETHGFTNYMEVTTGRQGNVIDVVSVCGVMRWGIEVKVTACLSVLDQAITAQQYCHKVSICVPYPASYSIRHTVEHIARKLGIGVFYFCISTQEIRKAVEPVFTRKVLKLTLYEKQKTFSPSGSANRQYWSPFRETCQLLETYVGNNPGVTLSEALRHIPHHYANHSSARGNLQDILNRGVIKTIEIKAGGLYLKEVKTYG